MVIPAYNCEATLAASLRSVLAENGVAEIVVVDDGSTDGTLALARRFEPAVRVLTGPNRGVSTARNRGFLATTAGWILFLDSDDLLMSGTIALRLGTAEASGADVIICDWEDMIDDGSGTITAVISRSVDWPALVCDAELAILTGVWATTAAIIYRRDLVERIGGFRDDLPIITDWRFLFDAARQGASFAHAPHLGAKYRVLSNSFSRRNPTKYWQDMLVNGQQIEALWRDKGRLNAKQLAALAGIYNKCVRALTWLKRSPHGSDRWRPSSRRSARP